MTAPLLSVNNLCVTHAGAARPTVANVSFDMAPGATLGIIGESGAGKSTIALALAGLLDRSEVEVGGEIVFEGRDLIKAGEDELCGVRGAGIGMIFQDPVGSLDPAMRVEDQVAEAIRMHRRINHTEARHQARQKLAEVGIDGAALDAAPYAHQLSGGLCQRAMIAAALACGPRLLIADEPTSSLDLTLQSQIIHLLKKRQQQESLAMIFISHDLALVSRVADSIAVLYSGKMVESGKRDAVLLSPSHEYTCELVSAWREEAEGGARLATA
jgi:ABC-type glutathione transport system ATPase component